MVVKVYLYLTDILPLPIKTTQDLTIGFLTQVENNLNLLNFFMPNLKYWQAILISRWRYGQQIGLNVAKCLPSLMTRTSIKPLMPHPLLISLGNPLSWVTKVRFPRKVKSLHGWPQNILSGSMTHASLSTIYYQTLTSRMHLTPQCIRNMIQMVTTSTVILC